MDPVVRNRAALARLERGGSRQWPIEVRSSAVIEVRALAAACPHCGGEFRLDEHTAPASGLRQVDVHCRMCTRPHTMWFRLVPDELN